MSSPLLLTRPELEQLTGTIQAKRMCDWLLARGWVFERPARRGDIPKVDRAYYSAMMSGQRPSAAPAASPLAAGKRLRLDWMTSPATT